MDAKNGSEEHAGRTVPWRALLGGLLAWNLGVTMLYLGERPALAEAPSCAAVHRELQQARKSLTERDKALKTLAQKVRSLARGNIRAIEKALTGTGLEVDKLIDGERKPGAGAGKGSEGQGGPFLPLDSAPAQAARDVERWDSLQRVVQVLPLGEPLAEYELTSGFGKRKDPINRRRAMHQGVDLKAPLRTPVQATGPGTVVHAGRKGRYGRVVEVDHGMGVRSRYAHLAAIKVKRGQRIADGQVVGLLGNSGRSTGPHLHYEVLVDDIPRNPHRFMRLALGAPTAADIKR